MASLSDMLKSNTEEEIENDSLIEALKTIIEMAENDELTEDEYNIIADSVVFISENENENEDEDLDEATLRKMKPMELKKARKYRKANKGRLIKAAKKRKLKLKPFIMARKKCAIKIAGKEGIGCNSKGKPYKKKIRK